MPTSLLFSKLTAGDSALFNLIPDPKRKNCFQIVSTSEEIASKQIQVSLSLLVLHYRQLSWFEIAKSSKEGDSIFSVTFKTEKPLTPEQAKQKITQAYRLVTKHNDSARDPLFITCDYVFSLQEKKGTGKESIFTIHSKFYNQEKIFNAIDQTLKKYHNTGSRPFRSFALPNNVFELRFDNFVTLEKAYQTVGDIFPVAQQEKMTMIRNKVHDFISAASFSFFMASHSDSSSPSKSSSSSVTTKLTPIPFPFPSESHSNLSSLSRSSSSSINIPPARKSRKRKKPTTRVNGETKKARREHHPDEHQKTQAPPPIPTFFPAKPSSTPTQVSVQLSVSQELERLGYRHNHSSNPDGTLSRFWVPQPITLYTYDDLDRFMSKDFFLSQVVQQYGNHWALFYINQRKVRSSLPEYANDLSEKNQEDCYAILLQCIERYPEPTPPQPPIFSFNAQPPGGHFSP